MRCNWRRWLWGLLPLLILSFIAVKAEQKRLESDLAQRAALALGRAGLGWAAVDFTARDGVLTGRAPREGEPAKAAELLRGLWGVRLIDNRAGLIEKAEQYQWWASRRNNRIRLSGYVPDTDTRQAILGVARASFPGFEVVDRMTMARGVPSLDVWLGGVGFALKQLASLRRGDVRLDDLNLGVSGEAEDGAAYRAMKSALSDGLPKGIKLRGEQVTPPVVSPYTWAAKFSGDRWELAGHVPSEADRARLLAAASASAPGAQLSDAMEPGDGAPQGWDAAAIACLRALPRLETASAELNDGVLTVSGVASDQPTADAVRGALRAALPASIVFTDQIRAKEPPPPPAPPPAVATPAPLASAPAAPPLPAPARDAAPTATGSAQAPVAAPRPAGEANVSATAPPPAAPPRVVGIGDPRSQACTDALANAAKAGTIQFRLGSAEFDAASFPTLDRLAAAAQSCPGMRIEVGGHASGEGGDAVNRRLALRRAQSVVAYLVRAGVDRQRLESAGFGATRPIAPNDTSEHMARNRRIEFTVRPQ